MNEHSTSPLGEPDATAKPSQENNVLQYHLIHCAFKAKNTFQLIFILCN